MTTEITGLTTALADRYRIERELGQGGMATVYLATDLRHHRPVAIKVVRSEISAGMGSERFLREIRLAASLNHPNILPLYDSGDAGGDLYYVMPVAEGESLRDRLTRDKTLSVPDAVRLASEVADALDYAHRREVVHRDIKPENILLHAGHALITDFGIGKALSTAATGATLTQLGLVVGTPAYMSPEQAGGEPELDGRTDLYSLGCVLYEMLAGEPPFTGSTVQAVIAKRFKETPPDATDARPSVPRPVADVARKLMAMEPSQRFATGAQVVEALAKSLTPSTGTAAYQRTAAGSGSGLPWIAVLSLQCRDPGLEEFAAGLSEDITTGLSRFPHLQVVSRPSAAQLPAGTDSRKAGVALGARYLIEGSIRKSATTIRLSAQLVDAAIGTQLWAEAFDRDLAGTSIFALQDELTDRIVATVADPFGILVRVMAKPLAERPVEELTAGELCIRAYAYSHVLGPPEHARLRKGFEHALETEPNHAEGWAALATLYWSEKMHLLNPLPNSLERALAAAQRAVQLDGASQPAWESLAETQYFLGDLAAFGQSAERVLALNPRNTSAGAIMAMLTAFGGEWERGFELVNRMMALNPLHAGWFYFVPFHYHYRKGEYARALDAVKRMNMPEMLWSYRCTASVCVELGRWEEARAAVLEMRRRFPAIEQMVDIGAGQKNWVHDAELMERQARAWARAVAAADAPSGAASPEPIRSTTELGPSRLPWIAVLPFANRDPELADLAEGIAEEVTAGLSKFTMLRVVAWQSAKRAKPGAELADAGKALGAKYLIEGSIRKSGRQVRVNVQLVEAENGTSLWAETFDRSLDQRSLFELQDELTDRIVCPVADPFGVLVRAMALPLKERPAGELTASELVIRLWAYSYQVGPEEHARLRDAFERVLEREPDHADAWGCLADLYWEEQLHGMNLRPDPLGRARRAAQRAVECDPVSQFGWTEVALVQYFSGDVATSRHTAERALALNPRNGATGAILAMALAFGGQWDRGYELINRLMDLNPHHAGWYHFIPFHYHFLRGEYDEALAAAKRANMPQLPWSYTTLAMAAAELGRWGEVERAMGELRRRFPHVLEILDSVPGAGWFMDQEIIALEAASWRKVLAGPAKTADKVQSIAVLPFSNMSPDDDDAYFTDGITEEIINALAQVPGLNVAARTSCFAFKGKNEDLRGVGEKLGVQHILEGSVRKAGPRVRITAQLIKACDGYHLWSERYDRELVDIFALQDEIANAIAAKLSLALLPASQERTKVRNLEAYELLLKGRALLWLRGRAILDALPCLERAAELDPELVDAHALLGDALRLKWLYGMAPARETIPPARAAIQRALALDPENPQALATLANIIAVHDLDRLQAIATSDRALRRDPRFVQALCEKAIWLSLRSDASPELREESLRAVRTAKTIDPLSSWAAALEAFVLLSAQRNHEAVDVSREAIALDPGAFTGRWSLVWALSATGADEEAIAAAREALPMSGRNPRILTEIAAIHARRGEAAAVQEILTELRQRAEADYIESSVLGCVTASAGNLPEARRLVARGIADHEPYFQFAQSPAWTAFRADPAGSAMLREVGF